MLNFTGEINICKYENGRTTTYFSAPAYDTEKKEEIKGKDGKVKKSFRELAVNFCGDARDISNCYNHTRIRVDNGWISFNVDTDKKVHWKLIINKAEIIEQGEGYKQLPEKADKPKTEEKKAQVEEPFAIGNADDLPF